MQARTHARAHAAWCGWPTPTANGMSSEDGEVSGATSRCGSFCTPCSCVPTDYTASDSIKCAFIDVCVGAHRCVHTCMRARRGAAHLAVHCPNEGECVRKCYGSVLFDAAMCEWYVSDPIERSLRPVLCQKGDPEPCSCCELNTSTTGNAPSPPLCSSTSPSLSHSYAPGSDIAAPESSECECACVRVRTHACARTCVDVSVDTRVGVSAHVCMRRYMCA